MVYFFLESRPAHDLFYAQTGCDLTLIPSGTNSTYRGTGTLSDDKMSVTINGFLYQKN